MPFVKVANASELPAGERIIVELDDMWIAVFNVNGQVYAIEDQCTHDGESLADEGVMHTADPENPKVECDRHGAKFELKTGKPSFPASVAVKRFPARLENDEVQINAQEPMQLG